MTSIRILLADDHPVVRDGLVAILNTQPDFNVVGEADSGSEAIRQTLERKPDVLLLDLEMPDQDGVQVIEHLQASGAQVKTLLFTAYDSDERILTALKLGANGYILKGAPREEVFNAIRVIASGGSLLEPVTALKLIRKTSQMDQPESPRFINEPLTEREYDVLVCMAQGMTNKEIARRLGIAERTVKFHISAILAKLGAGNRTEAVRVAAQSRLIHL